jgi:hypothetical protein
VAGEVIHDYSFPTSFLITIIAAIVDDIILSHPM